MLESFQYKGIFYLPGGKDKSIHGTLFYDADDGLTLDLMGDFPRDLERGIKFIYGELENGKAINLFNNFEIFRQFTTSGMSYAKYASNYLFVGDVLFTSEMDISFNKIAVHYSYIEDWLNIQTGFKKIDNNPKEHKVSIDYELPKSIRIPISDDKTVTMNFTAKPPPAYQMVRKEVSITQRTEIEFTYKRKAQLWSAFDDVSHFQNFLTLCLQRPAFVKRMRGFLNIRNSKKIYEVEVFFNQGTKQKEKEILPMDTLISYARISKIFPEVLKNWYGNMVKLKPTEDQYFSTYHSKQYFISDKFLSLARALEAFHRDTTGKKVIYLERLISLQKMYSSLYNNLLKIRNRKAFAKKVVDLRNDFTHSNPISRRNHYRFIKLHYLCENIQIMLSCMLLRYHGVPATMIKQGIKMSRLYTHISRKMR
jgi:hypothetical protein